MVVDEGQDFEQEWLDILSLFLRDGADILWLEDPDQNLQGKARVVLDDRFVRYRRAVNYRSPRSIARFILDTLAFDFEPGNDLLGMGVGVHGYADPSEQLKIVARLIQDLQRRGFTCDDIQVLTCRGVNGSIFSIRAGTQGCTSFPANPVSGSVLTEGQEEPAFPPEPGG
jgi:hypothetical protein